jgi:hypothetical protein
MPKRLEKNTAEETLKVKLSLCYYAMKAHGEVDI